MKKQQVLFAKKMKVLIFLNICLVAFSISYCFEPHDINLLDFFNMILALKNVKKLIINNDFIAQPQKPIVTDLNSAFLRAKFNQPVSSSKMNTLN